jgi:hypothetical protein
MFLLVCLFSLFIPIYNDFPNLYRYFALCFPYALIFVSSVVYVTLVHKKLKYFSLFFIYALVIFLYEARAGGDFGWYKECRSYIAFDTAAHPGLNASVFDGGADFAAYYGFTELPVYSSGKKFDVLYLPTQPSGMREDDLYLSLFNAGLDTGNILKIRINDERVILKKILKQ